MLPAATAAYCEMLAPGFHADRAFLSESRNATLSERFLFLFYLNVDTVAGRAERHEHHHVVNASEGISLGSYGGDMYILQQR